MSTSPDGTRSSGMLQSIVVAVVITLLAGGSAPWWWSKLFPERRGPVVEAPITLPKVVAGGENEKLLEVVHGAQADAKAGKYVDALAKAKAADAIQGKPAQLTRDIHQMIVAYAIAAKNYNEALTQLDKMIAAGEATQDDLNTREQLRLKTVR
jgi:hypothetical protein